MYDKFTNIFPERHYCMLGQIVNITIFFRSTILLYQYIPMYKKYVYKIGCLFRHNYVKRTFNLDTVNRHIRQLYLLLV